MIIYRTINLISGKIYIGQDSKNNENYFGSGVLIKQAIQKYGIENFKKEILEHCNSKEQLNKKEAYWINKLNSKVPVGYNLIDGGNFRLGYVHTEETKQKMRGIPCSEEHRQKISEANKGFKYSEEAKRKMSEIHKGKTVSSETRRKISIALNGVLCSEETKRKISITLKGRPSNMLGKHHTEVTKQRISKLCKGKILTKEHKEKISINMTNLWQERKNG